MAAYSAPGDLLLGGIPLPSYLDSEKIVQDAADEIDSKIGYVYTTPIDVSATSDLTRPAKLLLKRINNFLATGRLILQVASPEEDRNLHAYGWSLVKEATAALDAIASGEITLEGAPLEEGAASTPASSVPLISNLDSESNVEAFYDRMANPNYAFLPPIDRYSNPDRLVY
jgi:hypothetical protein